MNAPRLSARVGKMPGTGYWGYAWLLVAVAFLPLDAVWLGVMSDRLYQPGIGPLLAKRPDLLAAAAFYALYFIGVSVFAVRPALSGEPWRTSAARAALFGAVAYGTYDLTNQATLRDWPWLITLVDLCWGAFATALASLFAIAVLRRRQARSY
ncbi:MAG: DUF2177 family protein [Rhodocyclaceae bacterium]|nr:DUF2177 family protein [Rhodocyclaceae bacterium]